MIAINMEMPDSCYKCRLHNMKSVFDVSCAVTRKSVFHEFDTDSKPGWCPLKEIPDEAIVIGDNAFGVIQNGEVNLYKRNADGERRKD